MCKEIAGAMAKMRTNNRKDFLTALVPALAQNRIALYIDGMAQLAAIVLYILSANERSDISRVVNAFSFQSS